MEMAERSAGSSISPATRQVYILFHFCFIILFSFVTMMRCCEYFKIESLFFYTQVFSQAVVPPPATMMRPQQRKMPTLRA